VQLESRETQPNKQELSKRTYQTPQLFIYGSVREITRNAGPKGAIDGGGGAAAGPKTGV